MTEDRKFKVQCEIMSVGDKISRLASIGIIRKEREQGIGKLGLHGNFDTGIWKEYSYFVQNPVCGFYNFFEITTFY